MNRLKQLVFYFGLIGVSIGLWLVLWSKGALDGFEQETMRWRYLVRGEQASTAPIVFVDLDAESVAKIGARPWDRYNFRLLTDALLGNGEAKVLGYDIIFSMFSGGSLLDLERAREGNLRFGESIDYYKDQVVLASAYTGTTSAQSVLPLRRDGFVDPRQNPFPEAPSFPIITEDSGRVALANVDEVLSQGEVPYWLMAQVEVQGERFSRHLMQGKVWQLAHALNAPEVIVEGELLKLVDQDGWETYVLPRETEQRLFSLGLEMFLAAHELDGSAVEYDGRELVIRREGEVFRRVPLDPWGQSFEVNWFQGWSRNRTALAEHYSMCDVLERAHILARAEEQGDTERMAAEREWFARFKDKVIFVGPVDPQLKDIAPTPFNREPVPKVGLHANLYRTIQDEAYIVRLSDAGTVASIVLLTLAVTGLALWSGAGRVVTRFGSMGVVAVYAAAVFHFFASGNYVIPLIAPVGAALSSALCVVLLKLGSEEWQRRRVKALFGAYVSPELVDEMVDSHRDPELGGAEAEISALFSDVEDFSGFSEQLPPQELVSLMNEYLSAMTDALQTEGGTLDKYIGDAIVTMFGMPLPVKDHAARACMAALRMQERHAELREQWVESGKWPEIVEQMRTRIGINTGDAVIGNMGSRVRFNYTMMGDSVNLAARCESGAKSYGVYTMVTAATLTAALKAVPDLFYRKLDRIVVKGRSEPVEIYELWDASVGREQAIACREAYEAGLDQYFSGNWAAALERFAASEADEPSKAFAPTTPSAVLAQRCREFLEHGGPEGWDGAYRMQTK